MGTGVRKLAGWCQRHPQKLLSRAQYLLSGHFSHVHVATLLVIRRRQRVLQRNELVVHKYGEELCGDVSAYLTAFLPSSSTARYCFSVYLSSSAAVSLAKARSPSAVIAWYIWTASRSLALVSPMTSTSLPTISSTPHPIP